MSLLLETKIDSYLQGLLDQVSPSAIIPQLTQQD